MALFPVTDYDKKIWEEELKDFLPDKIMDCHTHVYKLEHKRKTPEDRKKSGLVSWTSTVAKDNPIEDLDETYKLMFPGKDVKALMFGMYETDANNDYLAEKSKEWGWPALFYSLPSMSADELEAAIRKGGFLGVKCYLSRSPSYIPAKEIRIFDFFPKHQLQRLNDMGAICMCHIPRDDRLKDPVNVAQIIEINKEFPKLRFIVAHVGRAYTKGDIGTALEDIKAQAPSTVFDFCANCCEYAITEVIRHFGPKQVMFGTDMPILRMRTHRIEENGTYVNLVPPGLYFDPLGDPHLREVSEEEGKKITFFAYEELLAFKRAAKTLGLTKQDIEDIMYNNINNMVEGARRDIYGE